MEYLTPGKIIEIHNEIIKEYGGTRGILAESTLELLTYKVNRENAVFKRAALILHTIAVQHPFFDGNKRTALVTAEKVLGDEGYYLDAEAEEKVALMQKTAQYKCSVKDIEKWVSNKAKELHFG